MQRQSVEEIMRSLSMKAEMEDIEARSALRAGYIVIPLSRHAGRRQRNQLRRAGEYPAGNEPKPWSKRSLERRAK